MLRLDKVTPVKESWLWNIPGRILKKLVIGFSLERATGSLGDPSQRESYISLHLVLPTKIQDAHLNLNFR